jgi:hypothetical protein
MASVATMASRRAAALARFYESPGKMSIKSGDGLFLDQNKKPIKNPLYLSRTASENSQGARNR